MINKKGDFIEKALKKHGNKYDYSKVDYKSSQLKVCIICPEHGEFWQTPSSHVRGSECPICANKNRGKKRLTNENFINKCKAIHQDKYSYEKTKYINSETKITITCPIHGDFQILPFNHLNGQGCPKCKNRNLTQEELIKKFTEIHGDKYNYSKVSFSKMKQKICIICPEHGEFWQTPYNHLKGKGCPACSHEHKFKTEEAIIEKLKKIHGDKYQYDNIGYNGYNSKIKITCPIHGEFEQLALNHLQGCGCPKCANNFSKMEEQIGNFLAKELNVNIILKDKSVIKPYELDILIPAKNIAIEFNGLRWHCDKFKENKNYHLLKTELCEKQNIRLIHIFEDEWHDKQDIVKSRLKSILGVTEQRIYARKCQIQGINFAEAKSFIEKNHIQGSCVSKFNYGLFYNNELVSVMSFGNMRKPLGSKAKEGCYELLRFCNKLNTTVVGSASKLLKYFIRQHKPLEIISYCDRRWSNGNMYEKIGFQFDHFSQPNYFYVINGKRENRFKYRKSELVKQGFDKAKTEQEIMAEREIYRIYDCGTKVYKWKVDKN